MEKQIEIIRKHIEVIKLKIFKWNNESKNVFRTRTNKSNEHKIKKSRYFNIAGYNSEQTALTGRKVLERDKVVE